MHRDCENYTEAAYTLLLHAELLQVNGSYVKDPRGIPRVQSSGSEFHQLHDMGQKEAYSRDIVCHLGMPSCVLDKQGHISDQDWEDNRLMFKAPWKAGHNPAASVRVDILIS